MLEDNGDMREIFLTWKSDFFKGADKQWKQIGI